MDPSWAASAIQRRRTSHATFPVLCSGSAEMGGAKKERRVSSTGWAPQHGGVGASKASSAPRGEVSYPSAMTPRSASARSPMELPPDDHGSQERRAALGDDLVRPRGESLYLTGGPDGPQWSRNLRANPECELKIGSRTLRGTARCVDDPGEAEAIRRRFVRKYCSRAWRVPSAVIRARSLWKCDFADARQALGASPSTRAFTSLMWRTPKKNVFTKCETSEPPSASRTLR